MKFSEIKTVIEFCNDNNIEDWKEVVFSIVNEESDFEVNDFRFIHTDEIDFIQQDELKSDLYILGCFNADFIADIVGVGDHDWQDAVNGIKAAQSENGYAGIGAMLLPHISSLQEEYVRLDGYGHHFSHYDGETLEDLLHLGFYSFRIN